MRRTQWMKIIAIAVLFSAGAIFFQGANAQQQEPKHPSAPATNMMDTSGEFQMSAKAQ